MTDRQTDRITTPKTALAYARAVKMDECIEYSYYTYSIISASVQKGDGMKNKQLG